MTLSKYCKLPIRKRAKISPDTLDLINSALDRVEPDLVVYSGDQIWGKRTFKGNRDAIKTHLIF